MPPMKLRWIAVLIAGSHLALVILAWGNADVIKATNTTALWSRVLTLLLHPLFALYPQSVLKWVPFTILLLANSFIWGIGGLLLLLGVRAMARKLWRRTTRNSSLDR